MKRLLIALILILLAAPAYAHDYKEGLAAFRLGDYTTAVEAWRRAAEEGDAKAQNNLAGMYDAGVGVAQSYTEAVRWYRRAGDQGLVWAQLNLKPPAGI
jgi:TPR repeat protein